MNVAARPIEVLLVEDNPTDAMITREALLETKIVNNLHVVENGDDAMSYLRKAAPFHHAIHPDLILLDLNLPRKPGYEVLNEIKQDAQLRNIPIVVLTASTSDADVARAHELQAACFVSKPIDFEAMFQVVRAVECFWLCIVTLPTRGS